MAADEMPQSRRRHSRIITAVVLIVGIVAGAFVLRRFLASGPRPETALRPVSQPSPAPPAPIESGSPPAVDDGTAPAAGADAEAMELDREPVEPDYEEWTVATLRTRARELGITGYSRLRKAELVAALRNAAL